MVAFLIKSLVLSAVFTAYYWFMLRDKKMHQYNRFYLLIAIMASLILPLCDFTLFIDEKEMLLRSQSYLYSVRSIVPLNNMPVGYAWPQFILISGIITGLLLLLFIFRLSYIYYIKWHNHIVREKGYNFIETKVENAPFTFLNNLFWRTDISLKEERGLKIFRHELAHIRGKHSLDRLFCQAIICIFWMNPFFWFIQKEITLIHEYIADAESLDEGDTDSFARMLLQSVESPKFFYSTHFFFSSSIKRRLAMITKLNKQPGRSLMRKILVIPLIILIGVLVVVMSGNAQHSTHFSSSSFFRPSSQVTRDTIYDSLYVDMKYIRSDGSIGVAKHTVKYIKNSGKSRPVIYDSADMNITYNKANGADSTVNANVKYMISADRKKVHN